MHPSQYQRRQAVVLSPAVIAMLSLRMDASVGTPTIWQKIAARLGFGAAIGMTPAEITATLAGDNADITQAETNLLNLFGPLFHSAEETGLADLQEVLQTVLSGAPEVTSVAGAVALVKTALTTVGGNAAAQAQQIGETSLTTLVSAALTSLGKVSLPAA